jgi:hypothetical protein
MLDLDKWENMTCVKCGKQDVRCCYGVCDVCRPEIGKIQWVHHVVQYKMQMATRRSATRNICKLFDGGEKA